MMDIDGGRGIAASGSKGRDVEVAVPHLTIQISSSRLKV